MDKETRNRIQRTTQAARALLEREYSEQLEGTFDIHLDGTIASKPGSHLSTSERILRQKLVTTVEHRKASELDSDDAVAAYVREAAFTTLNRFVALKMLEARGLVQECISRGEQSSGFKEFTGLAPGLVQLSDHGYRLYIESLFDEIGREVRVLFDRRDPSSLLWPRRQTLLDLLALLNRPYLTDVWRDDETIGWVYQYFNGDEERRQMRAESQAPRNSRELAVRNQFFTPRYVVEFLTDNTLGRIWYEMRQGKTQLVDKCDYLVRRPSEVFLVGGQKVPEDESGTDKNLSQEDLLKRTVYVPFRTKKDPRDLKILDPACGSGHFLLYAFDLLLAIYEEGWEDESGSTSEVTAHRLREDYVSHEELRRALPGLILRHNLHGIDIDPRAVQIAALALWIRAQRAYNDFGISRGERPPISKTNIVVAEPMPGEKELRQEFIASLDKDLGRLVKRVFEKMGLAGEAGSLLKIEDEIKTAIRDIFAQTGELFRKSDEERWSVAEARLVLALNAYAEQAQNGRAYRRRLFAEDAAYGFSFVNLCRQRYDAVVMNPPFGDPSHSIKQYVGTWYSGGSADIGAGFVMRGLALLCDGGRVGAITNRTLLAVQGFAEWRQELLDDAGLHALVDLGHGVLDAMVETAMYVCGGSGNSAGTHGRAAFLGLLESLDKRADLDSAFADTRHLQWRVPTEFRKVPGAPWAYWVPPSLLGRFASELTFLGRGGDVVPGVQTGDDFRFYRLRWEVPADLINAEAHSLDSQFQAHFWSPLAKGGEYSPWWDDVHLVQKWKDDGTEIKNCVDLDTGKTRSRPQSLNKLFRRGATYPYRTTSAFGLRLLPAGLSFSVGGWAVFAPEGWTDEEVLGTYNTRVARYFMEVLLGQGDSSAAGTAARNHVAAAVGGIPWPKRRPEAVIGAVGRLVDKAAVGTTDETTLFFSGAHLFSLTATTFAEVLDQWWNARCDEWLETADLYDTVEKAVINAYRLSDAESAAVAEGEGEPLSSYAERTLAKDEVAWMFCSTVEELTARAKEVCGAKRYTVKKAYFIDRSVDLACHILRAHPRSVIEVARVAGPVACGASQPFASLLLSWMLGCAVRRFRPASSGEVSGPSHRSSLPQVAIEEGTVETEIWVDDAGHQQDIVSLVQKMAEDYWRTSAERILRGALEAASDRHDLRAWCRNQLFGYHVSAYSKSRRKAPIYWQLATPGSAYSVWLSYQRLTTDTFYNVLNDYVTPKLQHEERNLASLVQSAGGSPTASQRKEIAEQEAFVEELRSFRKEVARIAPLWNPDLNDGVIINFAPIWRLVPQYRTWQKECKNCWDMLVAGEYDWAHLAMHLWPERVVPKCAEDRSLAIAHGLKEIFWVEVPNGKWQPRKVDKATVDKLIAERTSPAVKNALQSLLNAPALGTNRGSSRGKTGRRLSPRRSRPAGTDSGPDGSVA